MVGLQRFTEQLDSLVKKIPNSSLRCFVLHMALWHAVVTHLQLKKVLQCKRIKEQQVNKKFDNIKPTQLPVLNISTDNTTVAVMMDLAQFNVEEEYIYA